MASATTELPGVDVPQVLSSQALAALSPTTLLGRVINVRGSAAGCSSAARTLIEFESPESGKCRILAELALGVSVRIGDRVLLVVPANAAIAIVTAVLPGERQLMPGIAPATTLDTNSRPAGQALVLHDAESLRVTTSTGQTLIAIEQGASGPLIRLGQGSLELDMPGELHLMADSLRFTTRSGPISIESQTDDVVVQGRTIRLN